MARYDKYDPYDGGFRAPLAAAIDSAHAYKIYAVGLDSSGRVVLGAGNSGIVGVMVAHGTYPAGEIVDVMTDGEILEATLSDGTTALTAGTKYYGVNADGTITATATSNVQLGFTVENTRFVARVAR
jgi:hypothetical protein